MKIQVSHMYRKPRICEPLVSWISSHSIFDDTFQVNNPHRTWLFQSCLVSLQSTGLFVTESNWWAISRDILTERNRFEDNKSWHHCAPMICPLFHFLTQWPLIVLKSSWVDSQWAELNGNTPCLCVARPIHVVSFSVKWVIRYWSFILEEETHITHCIVW